MEKYKRWLAYGHLRTKEGKRARSPKQSVFGAEPGNVVVYVGGKRHHVEHGSRPWKRRECGRK